MRRRTVSSQPSGHSCRRRFGIGRGASAILLIAAVYLPVLHARLSTRHVSRSQEPSAGALAWPAQGQAAVLTSDWTAALVSPELRPAPIASVAKLMTAVLVLRDQPLGPDEDGPALRVTQADVEDTADRAGQDQSVVKVEAGEKLTERQALQAILIPSANNVAVMLARWASGSVGAFVAQMNETARAWRLRQTHYTDPSGFDPGTVSTASDQLTVARKAMRLPVLAQIVGMSSATLPVAGTVRNTDALLGRGGIVGVKTGSDDAAGGCFAFQASYLVAGRRVTVVGVVLGQRGAAGLLPAAFESAASLLAQLSR